MWTTPLCRSKELWEKAKKIYWLLELLTDLYLKCYCVCVCPRDLVDHPLWATPRRLPIHLKQPTGYCFVRKGSVSQSVSSVSGKVWELLLILSCWPVSRLKQRGKVLTTGPSAHYYSPFSFPWHLDAEGTLWHRGSNEPALSWISTFQSK